MRNLDRTYSGPSCEQGGVQKARSTTRRILKCGNSTYYNIHIHITTSTFEYTNIIKYTRNLAYQFLKFRGGKQRTAHQTEHKTCCEL